MAAFGYKGTHAGTDDEERNKSTHTIYPEAPVKQEIKLNRAQRRALMRKVRKYEKKERI